MPAIVVPQETHHGMDQRRKGELLRVLRTGLFMLSFPASPFDHPNFGDDLDKAGIRSATSGTQL